MHWIEWALSTGVGTSEKLLLVYLATRANRAGVGLMEREELQRVMGFETRSIQRLLKTLRDAGMLADAGAWYVLRDPAAPALAQDAIDTLPAPPEGSVPAPLTGPLMQPAEIEQAAERLGAAIQDGAEFLVDQLNNAEARFAGMLVRGAQQIERVLVECAPRLDAPPAPPPDPVKESPLYVRLLDAGIAEDLAYSTVKAQMEREHLAARAEVIEFPDHPVVVLPGTPKRDAYTDDVSGRFMRVWDILHDKPPTDEARLELGAIWSLLEEDENKHTVKGESVTAFENLYPAIVRAAEQQRGRMPMSEFLNPRAIKDGRAPWDVDPSPAPAEDAVLEADIARMLRELAAFNDPRATVGKRTTEKGEDGITRQETILAFHRRVKAKLDQMIKLRDMGALT